MEATGRYWVALFDFLISHGYEAAVINPIQTDAFRGVWTVRKVKTDALDAAMIADLVRYKRYEPSALGDEATEELRNLARYRLSLVERSTALKNRATAILDRTFPELAGLFSNAYCPTHRELLQHCATPDQVLGTDVGTLERILREASRGRCGRAKAERLKALAKESVGVGFGSKTLAFEARLLMEELDFVQDQVKEVERELARLLEADRQFSEANEIYNSLIEQDPDNPDIWIRMVEGQIRAGKGQKALDYALNGPATYGYKLTAATLFLDARMYPEAEALLDGLKSDPNAPDEVHFYLAAIAYEYHKDVQETLNFLESIPPENRFYDRALRLRIQLLHDQQRYEDAMQLILQGQSQFPTERDFRLMEIHLYLLQDRYKEALTAATAAQQIWPSDDEIAYVYGSVLDSLGRKREALAMMESIVARNPEDYQALNYVGYSLAEQGKDLDRAVLLLEAALKQAPDHAYILDSLAWAHFRRGENAEAWALVRRATSLPDGGDPTIWEHYGDIANAQGLKNEARTGWERALELDHPNPETIRKKLNSL